MGRDQNEFRAGAQSAIEGCEFGADCDRRKSSHGRRGARRRRVELPRLLLGELATNCPALKRIVSDDAFRSAEALLPRINAGAATKCYCSSQPTGLRSM